MAAQRSVYAATKWLYNRFSGGSGVAPEYSFDNNKWLQERSSDNTADINMIKVDANNNVLLGTSGNSVIVTGSSFSTLATPASNNTAGNVNPILNTSLINAVYQRNCAGTPRTDTTDTAANVVTALGSAGVVGQSFTFVVSNVGNAANALTIAGGTNVTINGNAIVANNTCREFIGVVANTTTPAITLYAQGA